MARFAKKREVAVALKCQVCHGITNYPLNTFPRREYRKDGFIMQYCGCGGHGRPSGFSPFRSLKADSLGNTRHKIVGVFVEQQIPANYDEAKKLLGNLIE